MIGWWVDGYILYDMEELNLGLFYIYLFCGRGGGGFKVWEFFDFKLLGYIVFKFLLFVFV